MSSETTDINDGDKPVDYDSVPAFERLDFWTDPDPEPSEIIRAKGVIDGAATLSEAADQLEAFAKFLRGEEENGKQLTEPVKNDYGEISEIPGFL
jgi:hypothetical protein